jgi:transposase
MEQTQHNASCTALRALRGDEMVEPDEVAQMLRLKALGWGTRRIAVELGVNRGTVKRYIKAGGWTPYVQPKRRCLLDGHEVWLKERFKRHAGNADVVRQELTTELGVTVSLRTLQRALQPFRQELRAEARATVRFETLPGRQMQIDFGERMIENSGSICLSQSWDFHVAYMCVRFGVSGSRAGLTVWKAPFMRSVARRRKC